MISLMTRLLALAGSVFTRNVASTIALAHSVGLTAIAEGVESARQLTMLRQMGCDFAQGYLFSPPLPVLDLVDWLGEQSPARLFGRLDVLVNAGASTARGTIIDTTPETFDELFATNVRGPYFLMQAAIRLMIARGTEGAICNIGSISALSGQPFISAYCGSKGALTTLTANTAFAVAANRIRVNQLNVGWMASDHERQIQAAGSDPDWEVKAAAALPFGRLVDPDEAARAVNFLVSADAGLMTGAIVNFDQSVWGAVAGGMPAPDGPLRL